MNPVLLFHPLHGNKHAYHPDEIKADQANGWQVVEDKPEETKPEVDAPRRGRPPKVQS